MRSKFKTIMVPLALGACTGGAIAEEQDKPNIIIVYLEDLGYADLSCYGGQVNTPYVDRLAENGIRFTNAYDLLVSSTQL